MVCMGMWERELQVAVDAAQRAGEVALRYQKGITAETKPDDSPVTMADRECERLIAEALTAAFPDDGLLGEEGTARSSANGRKWIIDPIDGTRDYVRGNPLWSTLIGLEADGRMVVGVAHLPVFGGRFTAGRGIGAFQNGTKIHSSECGSTSQAVVCFNGFNRTAKTGMGSTVDDLRSMIF